MCCSHQSLPLSLTFMMTTRSLLTVALLFCALAYVSARFRAEEPTLKGSALISDSPYEETLAGRLALKSLFPSPSSLPTGWESLSCDSVSSISWTNVEVKGNNVPIPIILCFSEATNAVTVVDLFQNAPFTSSISLPGSNWTIAQLSSAYPIGSQNYSWPPPLVVVSSTSAYTVDCAYDESNNAPGVCTFSTLVASHNVPHIQYAALHVAQIKSSTDYQYILWAGGMNGTAAYGLLSSDESITAELVYSTPYASTALAYSDRYGVIALGNTTHLLFLDGYFLSFPLARWEWVTETTQGWGGVVDDVITALQFDAVPDEDDSTSTSLLYIGNPTCLNIAVMPWIDINRDTPLSSDECVADFFRIAGEDGLPYGNITSLALDATSTLFPRPSYTPSRLWIGTTQGVILFDPMYEQLSPNSLSVPNKKYLNFQPPVPHFAPDMHIMDKESPASDQISSTLEMKRSEILELHPTSKSHHSREDEEDEDEYERGDKRHNRIRGQSRHLRSFFASEPTLNENIKNIPGKKISDIHQRPLSSTIIDVSSRWRWFSGGRYLPVSASQNTNSSVSFLGLAPFPHSAIQDFSTVSSLETVGKSVLKAREASARLRGKTLDDVGVVPCQGGVFVMTLQGASILCQAAFTLEQKALFFEQSLANYSLYSLGIVSDRDLPSMGVTNGVFPSPDANNGLWTSLTVASFGLKASITQDPTDFASMQNYISGMQFLNTVTGVKGLFARSVQPTPNSSIPSGWNPSNSTTGWIWNGDTSSDEAVGHAMAYGFGLVMGNPNISAISAATMFNIARYIVSNNYTLIDITGNPTTWGHWSPDYLNGMRSWSDVRGLNSLEISVIIVNGILATQDPNSGASPEDLQLLIDGLAYLVQEPNNYGANSLNAKIIVPDDDNYSDDELLFFSYISLLLTGTKTSIYLNNLGLNSAASLVDNVAGFAQLSMLRSIENVQFVKSSLWNVAAALLISSIRSSETDPLDGSVRVGSFHFPAAVTKQVRDSLKQSTVKKYFSSGAAASPFSRFHSLGGHREFNSHNYNWFPTLPDYMDLLTSMVWDLRNWHIENIDWYVDNSIRKDLTTYPEIDRDFDYNDQAIQVLPKNEISFMRWNSNPRSYQSGSGYSDYDPSAYLFPYWFARATNFVDPPE